MMVLATKSCSVHMKIYESDPDRDLDSLYLRLYAVP
jgi:hypothetical protein